MSATITGLQQLALTRRIFSQVPDTVSVMTTGSRRSGPRGLTVTSYCSVSDSPSQLLVCVHRHSESLPSMLRRGAFALNDLSTTASGVADRFAGSAPSAERFSGVEWTWVGGLLVLSQAVAWTTCSLAHTYTAGDHVVIIGSLDRVGLGSGDALVRYRGGCRAVV